MKIIGIDPGTATTGFGVIEMVNRQIKYVEGGIISTPPKQALQKRLLTIFTEVSELVNQHRPDQIAIESLYFAANATTAMSVAHARGVVMLAAAQANLPVAEYTPLQVKQAITNYGRADKKQMQEMVKTLLGLKQIPRPDDAADALAVAICHAATI